jgi:hypothetical protein
LALAQTAAKKIAAGCLPHREFRCVLCRAEFLPDQTVLALQDRGDPGSLERFPANQMVALPLPIAMGEAWVPKDILSVVGHRLFLFKAVKVDMFHNFLRVILAVFSCSRLAESEIDNAWQSTSRALR